MESGFGGLGCKVRGLGCERSCLNRSTSGHYLLLES